ncbi:uncharacterized protein LOC131434047 [Malaya genurostris]|uniref:uncharacterized protein LOC131434047 n=1 Tax=Malaya genurostris TaxID=325434 RepID=UPI0026F3BAA7|nr:uncharacterized protein LOC131434047 [Malaya genurostris]
MKCIAAIGVIFALLFPVQTFGVVLPSLSRQRWPWLGIKTELPVEDCGAPHDIISVQLSSCSSSPCSLPRGTNVTVNAEFSSNGTTMSGSLKHEVYFILNSVKTKATVIPATCEGTYCPFQGEVGLRFTATLLVNSTLPMLRGSLQWELRNDSTDVMLCYKIQITVR